MWFVIFQCNLYASVNLDFSYFYCLPYVTNIPKEKAVLKTARCKLLQTVVSGSSTLWIRQNTSPSESALISCVPDLIVSDNLVLN